MTDSQKPARRMPKQARSRRRYQHILDTAAQLFAQDGIDSVTTNHIAAAASVSIGSLYQFFPNKEALLDALTERYLEQMTTVFPDEIDTQIPVEEFIRGVVTQFVRFEGDEAGFRVILLHMESSAANEAAEALHNMLVAQIDRVLAAYYPALSAEDRHLCAAVSLALTKGVMALREPPESLPQTVIIEQIHSALVHYQRAFLRAVGVLDAS